MKHVTLTLAILFLCLFSAPGAVADEPKEYSYTVNQDGVTTDESHCEGQVNVLIGGSLSTICPDNEVAEYIVWQGNSGGQLSSQGAVGAQSAISALGGETLRQLEIIGGASARLISAQVDALRTAGWQVSQAREFVPDVTNTQVRDYMGMNVAHAAGYTGAGLIAAIIDTGVDTDHPAFNNCAGPGSVLILGGNFVGGPSVEDDNGHGTHVADTLHDEVPCAQILIEKACTNSGQCTEAAILAALGDVKSRVQAGDQIKVLSMSLSGPATLNPADDPLVSSLDQLIALGVLPFLSAGNSGPNYGTLGSPSIAPQAVTVGSISFSADPTVSTFSSQGSLGTLLTNGGLAKPEITAPGEGIESAAIGGGTTVKSGTSMSTPAAAGVGLVMYQYLGVSATPMEVKSALLNMTLNVNWRSPGTSLPLAPSNVFARGAGRPNWTDLLADTARMNPGIVFAGMHETNSAWNSTVVVSVKNITTTTRTFSFGSSGMPGGVIVTFSPSSVVLTAGASQNVSVTVNAPGALAFPPSPSIYEGKMITTDTGNGRAHPVPLFFGRARRLILNLDVPPTQVFVYREVGGSTFLVNGTKAQAQTIAVPGDVSQVGVMVVFSWSPLKMVIREGIILNPSGATVVNMASSEAIFTVNTKLKYPDGQTKIETASPSIFKNFSFRNEAAGITIYSDDAAYTLGSWTTSAFSSNWCWEASKLSYSTTSPQWSKMFHATWNRCGSNGNLDLTDDLNTYSKYTYKNWETEATAPWGYMILFVQSAVIRGNGYDFINGKGSSGAVNPAIMSTWQWEIYRDPVGSVMYPYFGINWQSVPQIGGTPKNLLIDPWIRMNADGSYTGWMTSFDYNVGLIYKSVGEPVTQKVFDWAPLPTHPLIRYQNADSSPEVNRVRLGTLGDERKWLQGAMGQWVFPQYPLSLPFSVKLNGVNAFTGDLVTSPSQNCKPAPFADICIGAQLSGKGNVEVAFSYPQYLHYGVQGTATYTATMNTAGSDPNAPMIEVLKIRNSVGDSTKQLANALGGSVYVRVLDAEGVPTQMPDMWIDSGSGWQPLTVTGQGSNNFSGAIPTSLTFESRTAIKLKIVVYDNAGNTVQLVLDPGFYVGPAVPELQILYLPIIMK